MDAEKSFSLENLDEFQLEIVRRPIEEIAAFYRGRRQGRFLRRTSARSACGGVRGIVSCRPGAKNAADKIRFYTG